MDSRGTIYHEGLIKELDRRARDLTTHPTEARRIHRKLTSLVAIPEKLVEELTAAPRSVRRAWYSDYRRAQKRAAKTGRPVEIPEMPSA